MPHAHPLLARLTTERGWPALEDMAAVDAFLAEPGARCLFVTGDPAKNLETTDAAVILPELVRALAAPVCVGVVGPEAERAVRERFEVWPTPSLIFTRDGAPIGAIPKVRDWDDYLDRAAAILAPRPEAGAAPRTAPQPA